MSAPGPVATDLGSISLPSRTAAPGEGITTDELALAARNHAMPAEALRWEITPPGLHYVLTHYDIPDADAQSWAVTVTGAVERDLLLSLEDLATMEQHTVRVTMECAGNGRAGVDPRPLSQPWITGAVGTADWSGVRVKDVLADAGISANAVDVVFCGADHGVERGVEQDYERALSVHHALDPDLILATTMNGVPLPPQHGFPLRLVVPGWYGMTSVKWLREIRLIDEQFTGYQHQAYRLKRNRDDVGTPVTRIEPRALLVPPGFPDFMSRTRVVEAGHTEIRGRAWSGWGLVTRVEFSPDDGVTWSDCTLHEDNGVYAWRAFSTAWDAVPGPARLRVRATDATGRVQPLDPVTTLGGFTNNADQAVTVVVR
jgi:DMSO/TMAO reductase YedYZ molybdopterin-dependent catalytic subunit